MNAKNWIVKVITTAGEVEEIFQPTRSIARDFAKMVKLPAMYDQGVVATATVVKNEK